MLLLKQYFLSNGFSYFMQSIGDHMSDIRLLFGRPEVIKLPVLLNRGNSLMSWEEIDIPIFKKMFSYWVEMTVSVGV